MTRLLTPETDYGQYRCGESNRNAKLTEDKVRLIRMLLAKGNRQKTIAEINGVSQKTISSINIGRTWRWVI